MANKKKDYAIFYGWYIAFVGTIAYALGYGARYSFSVIFPSLLEEFKWPRDLTATMLSVHILVYGFTAPLTGYLVDRTGPRRTMVLGAVLLSLGLILSCFGNEFWHFWISFGLLAGTGLCLMGSVPFTTVIRNWFEKKRGLAFSLIFAGSGGAFAFYPVIAWLIERSGWRNTFLIEGFILGGVMIPLVILIVRYHPRDKGLFRDGLAGGQESFSAPLKSDLKIMDHEWAAVDWTFAKAIKTSRFWLLALTTFSMWGIMQHILVAHQVAFAIDVGYSKIFASFVLSLSGIMFAVGSLASLISDRIGREITITIGSVIGISGIIVLTMIHDASRPWMLYYYAISMGVSNGLCAPTIAASVTDIFQGPRVGFTIGAIWVGFAFGGAIGPWLGGWLFELTGNYHLAFIVAIILFAVACLAIWLAAPRKVRARPRF
ncbi:MAG: MFS transporter [Deltaproteobacteria bacterium]|nr:MFS transporter [Deltaproteobacteria bacterium]